MMNIGFVLFLLLLLLITSTSIHSVMIRWLSFSGSIVVLMMLVSAGQVTLTYLELSRHIAIRLIIVINTIIFIIRGAKPILTYAIMVAPPPIVCLQILTVTTHYPIHFVDHILLRRL